jgi:arginyl-tRNA--protein-N-Asp/Glu arginylyltransferase
MCLLCDDEKSYQLYMDYLDQMERQGEMKDVDAAMDAILDKVQAAQIEDDKKPRAMFNGEAPENDKTLSPFFCSPVNK